MGGIVRNLFDGLFNVVTGLGGRADPRSANAYAFTPLPQQSIEAAYRGSGMMRKVVDIPAFDMVREWRDWQAEADQIELLEAEECRLGLRGKIMLAEIYRGLGGGALILGAPGDANMPVNLKAIGKGGLAYVHVVSRWALQGHDWIDVLTDPMHGGPAYWTFTAGSTQQRIHPSRVVAFTGDPVPDLVGSDPETRFWGESRVQRVLDAVQNSDTAQSAFATLITKARNTIIGIPGLLDTTSTTEGMAALDRRMLSFAALESMFNVTLRDAGDGKEGSGETIDHRQVVWTGIPELMDAFDQRVAAVADIPMTRLVGRSPAGMNATGNHDMQNWNKMVRARQTLFLEPCLDRVDEVLIPSALGSKPDDVWSQFAPLDTPSETEEAERFKTTAEAMKLVSDMGFVPDEAFAKGGQNTLVEGGWMPGLEGALAEIPEAERYGLSPEEDETDPSKLVAANENAVAEMQKKGAITADQATLLLKDAAPRTLYVRRDVVNVAEIRAWAEGQGIPDLVDDLHVTIIYSRQPLDWIKAGNAMEWGDKDGKMTLPPGGPRVVEPLGNMGAALLFASSELGWRHLSIVEAGASHDFDGYVPHISLTKAEIDVGKIEPYRGEIVLGPEIFEELDEGTT